MPSLFEILNGRQCHMGSVSEFIYRSVFHVLFALFKNSAFCVFYLLYLSYVIHNLILHFPLPFAPISTFISFPSLFSNINLPSPVPHSSLSTNYSVDGTQQTLIFEQQLMSILTQFLTLDDPLPESIPLITPVLSGDRVYRVR